MFSRVQSRVLSGFTVRNCNIVDIFEFIIHTHIHTHEVRVEPINAYTAQRGGQKRRQQESLQALGWVCEAFFEKWSHVFIVRLRFGHYILSTRHSFARIRVSTTIACVIALLCKLLCVKIELIREILKQSEDRGTSRADRREYIMRERLVSSSCRCRPRGSIRAPHTEFGILSILLKFIHTDESINRLKFRSTDPCAELCRSY
ncbi:unnamed protein product [Trichogramma brassicae]|uniref:Uncharacterized protein n=1 Tax=Trichogramma brassicae TaxID=86971 RepID=A0A6H5J357_9HYME|nr:unnamed protein product [Trichogramma brassicae]